MFAGACALVAQAQQAPPTDEQVELAKKLANPVANLISVPLQYNSDKNYGENDEGGVSRLNIQPVVPFSLNADWNLITRTIIPLVNQKDLPGTTHDKFGLGDITASQFFSPKQPTERGWIWGAGPVELLPTASNANLGGEQWGVGPTAILLKQFGPWTAGGLVNHVWSVSGVDSRSEINATFLQPFVSYILPTKTTLGLNTEATYDWVTDAWSVPVNLSVSQLLKLGPQILQVGVGVRYWAESPANGPEGWGLRATLTFLFPK